VELPTYTSIWRIEKRLYKLYDFRLPMPLPVGQIVVFMAITIPYVLLLTLLGLPFSHTLFWLYVLPPGLLTWLATRPVLESKRLPELVISQVRYLGEPSVWCRMAPLAEKDDIIVTGRVWRRGYSPPGPAAPATAAGTAITQAGQQTIGQAGQPASPARATGRAAGSVRVPAAGAAGGQDQAAASNGELEHGDPAPTVPGVPWPSPARSPRPTAAPREAAPARVRAPVPRPALAQERARAQERAGAQQRGRAQPPTPAPVWPATAAATAPARPAPAAPPVRQAVPAGQAVPARQAAPPDRPAGFAAAPAPATEPARAPATEPARPPATATPPGPPPVVVVPAQRAAAAGPPTMRPPTVERALGGPAGQRSQSWHHHAVVVPGGVGPGRPDYDKRDRTRATQPVDGSRLVAVLGCTVGAGQTVTTLIVAELLASLRGDLVAALDLNPGPASLGELAAPQPPVMVSSLLAAAGQVGGPRQAAASNGPPTHQRGGPGRLDVVAPAVGGDGSPTLSELEYRRLFDVVAARYPLGFADPGAAAVTRVLGVADQLVLVAPASPDAARSLAMTTEWLAAHGYGALAANSITVLNGLSKRSMPHAEQAELVVRGRCRAIVRVPWDDHLAEPPAGQGIPGSPGQAGEPSRLSQLRPPVLAAYTALAGVLVASLTSRLPQRRAAR
jgi:MinD-like ATPase involved in chromosome partitioning or flagellar assembly